MTLRALAQRIVTVLLAVVSMVACGGAFRDPPAPIVQPGAPGEPGRVISPEAAADLSQLRYTAAEVQFVQRMLLHHAQALEMTALLPSRGAAAPTQLLAKRIELSQRDEIALMREWLGARGVPPSNPDPHQSHGASVMPGMLTPDEMGRLAAASGPELDRLFLELMIKHHAGALIMVDDLFAAEGAAQQSDVFSLASEIETDQRVEIERMRAMLEEHRK
jgi:uncharacterized protein (DUF305 family)